MFERYHVNCTLAALSHATNIKFSKVVMVFYLNCRKFLAKAAANVVKIFAGVLIVSHFINYLFMHMYNIL